MHPDRDPLLVRCQPLQQLADLMVLVGAKLFDARLRVAAEQRSVRSSRRTARTGTTRPTIVPLNFPYRRPTFSRLAGSP